MDKQMDKYMEAMLKTADEVLADVKNHTNGKSVGSIGEYAIVSKDEYGIIHLEYTCNCTDEYYTIENYGGNGWYVKPEDLTEDNFWDVWTTWNGYVCGSIYLDDHDYEDDYGEIYTPEWDDLVSQYKEVSIDDLKTLPPGEYALCA